VCLPIILSSFCLLRNASVCDFSFLWRLFGLENHLWIIVRRKMKTSLVVQPFQKQTENCESSGFVGGGASCGFDVDVCAARSAE